MPAWRLPLAGALAAALGLATLQTASAAAPAPMPPGAAKAEADGLVTEVRGGHRGHWGHRGPGISAGIGLGIIGGIIASEAYRGPYYYDSDDYPYDDTYDASPYRDDPREACAARFQSFEWRTGLYTTYSGEKRLCPYLR
jgi:hypothetical protein